MVGVVGINVAGELAGRDGESGALDGLHEEGSRGLTGEGGDARARVALRMRAETDIVRV